MKTTLKFELIGIVVIILSVLALSQTGPVPRAMTYLFRFMIGTMDFVFPIIGIYIGLFVMIKRQWPRWTVRKTGLLLVLLGLLIMSHMGVFKQIDPKQQLTTPGYIIQYTWNSMLKGIQPSDEGLFVLTHEVGGGMVGALLYGILFFLFNNLGALLIECALFAIGFVLITGLSYVDIANKLKQWFGYLRIPAADDSEAVHTKKQEKQTKPEKAAKSKVVVPMDDDIDEENFNPIKHRGKRPLFFELLQPSKKAAAQNQYDPELFDDELPLPKGKATAKQEEIVVYASEDQDLAGPPADAPKEEPAIPLIRDFQDHPDAVTLHGEAASEPGSSQEEQQGQLPAVKASSSGQGEDMPASDAVVLKEVKLEKPYQMPSFSLLSKPPANKSGEHSDYKANARKLEATLESFGVRAKVLEVVRGPSVTRYEIQPDVGVKVSRIVSLTDDIALALAAKDIRMEAPIPGKSAIGIEVPNTEVSVVTMREVMESSAFLESNSKMTVVLGRDISGQAIVGNLARMPHLLVAGATGSGKSVCINGIITSVLYKAKPDEVKFLMIDPKMVELNVYNGIPHLLAPVVTDPRRASLALKKVVSEMEKRYELFSKSGTRNIEGYNSLIAERNDGTELLPFIVVIVDELADLMMVAAGDVEDAICRLAQMARAAGIHLIIATQRPSVDVITGVIKANIPSRIAFGVSSQVDSRTILDSVGAEKLLGRGDMLYLPVGASKPLRIQGAFLSDQEVESVVSFVKNQAEAEYREELVPEIEETADTQDQVEDELFDQAVQIILEAKQASVSLLQRRMRIGYTRAARLIDTMEARGIVGPYEGSKPREVLVTMEQYHHNRISS
ncbi:FtsK/SpoIIIE family DNA translocase [Paenibacillus sp. y28]|uniref:FtsK/SpoIIIE family DNA translocase n=1 Tax=Paenibacillus sp. y28 TaxID=3129110 RepID=UPI0030198203